MQYLVVLVGPVVVLPYLVVRGAYLVAAVQGVVGVFVVALEYPPRQGYQERLGSVESVAAAQA